MGGKSTLHQGTYDLQGGWWVGEDVASVERGILLQRGQARAVTTACSRASWLTSLASRRENIPWICQTMMSLGASSPTRVRAFELRFLPPGMSSKPRGRLPISTKLDFIHLERMGG